MPEETKMRKCRMCGKDTEVGKPCSNDDCGWDEEAEAAEVRRNRAHAQIAAEMDEAEKKKSGKKDAPKRRGLFGR